MLSILILSNRGENYDLATRLAREKHLVKFYSGEASMCKEEDSVRIISSWKQHFKTADLILHSPGYGRAIKDVDGTRGVFGGGILSDWISLSEESFDRMKVLLSTKNVENAIKVTVGGVIGRNGLKQSYLCLNSERFMDGDKGPIVNGMGCLVRHLSECRLVDETIKKLENFLVSSGFIGIFELDLWVAENGFDVEYFSPFSRNGSVQALIEGIFSPLGETLYHLSIEDVEMKPFNGFSIAVGLSLPPWPYAYESYLDLDIPEPAVKHVWLSGVKGFLGYVTSRGNNIREAKRRVYRTVKNIATSPEIQYRSDIGADEYKLNKLVEWRWIDASISNTEESVDR